MFTSLIYTAANDATLDLFHDEMFDTINADGLTLANTSIAASTVPTMDGDTINNVQANPRGITFDFRVKNYVDVEACKRHILNVIKLKQNGTLTFTQGTGKEQRIITISGVVQSIELPRFSNACTMQVSLYCSAPFWQDLNDIILQIARALPAHHFEVYFPINAPIPLGIIDQNMTQVYTNDGDAAAGMIITIIATGDVTNPTLYRSTGEYIGINDTLTTNDKVVIDTNRGHKTITKNGVSIFSKIKQGSTFLQMETGDNEFTIDADTGDANMYFTIAFKRRFV